MWSRKLSLEPVRPLPSASPSFSRSTPTSGSARLVAHRPWSGSVRPNNVQVCIKLPTILNCTLYSSPQPWYSLPLFPSSQLYIFPRQSWNLPLPRGGGIWNFKHSCNVWCYQPTEWNYGYILDDFYFRCLNLIVTVPNTHIQDIFCLGSDPGPD